MTIYIIRHGRAAAGVDDLDPGLDESGQQQALCVSQAFAGRPVGRLIVSPMRRTRETIAPLAMALGIEPEVREEVSEVFDPAMAADARRGMIGPFMQGRWSDQPAELQAWRQRCLDAVLDLSLATGATNRDLVIVSHYIAICAVIGEATDNDRVVPVPVANASVSSFELVHGSLQLLAAGDTSHLPAELVSGVNTALLSTGP
ncbi:MAG: histidine phosphatase family protein [Tepidiformaceae bacterium]